MARVQSARMLHPHFVNMNAFMKRFESFLRHSKKMEPITQMIFKEHQERNRAGILSGRIWGLECDNHLTSI